MNTIPFFSRFLLIIPICVTFFACGQNHAEIWQLDNFETVAGHPLTVLGNPVLVDTEYGKAVRFLGNGDALLVDSNPLSNTTEFTVEALVKPEACYPSNTDPRFIHIQNPADSLGKRLMLEWRITPENKCYLDVFLKTDTTDLVLIDEKLTHPTEEWLAVAVTYKANVLTSYINGVKQGSGQVGYLERFIDPVGKVSIGGRMDRRNWFRGTIRELRFSNRALEPSAFGLLQESKN